MDICYRRTPCREHPHEKDVNVQKLWRTYKTESFMKGMALHFHSPLIIVAHISEHHQIHTFRNKILLISFTNKWLGSLSLDSLSYSRALLSHILPMDPSHNSHPVNYKSMHLLLPMSSYISVTNESVQSDIEVHLQKPNIFCDTSHAHIGREICYFRDSCSPACRGVICLLITTSL